MSDLPEWAQSLPESLHELPHLKGAETPEAFVQQVQTDAQWRGQSIRIPKDDAGAEVWDEFKAKIHEKVPVERLGEAYARHGVPDEPSAYRIPEGIELPDADAYKKVAHSLNIAQSDFDAWLTMEASANQDKAAMAQEAHEKGYSDLRLDWGAAYDQNYKQVADVLRDAPEGVQEAYKAGTLPADQVRWLHGLAELAGESKEIQNKREYSVMTPEQAALELEEFKSTYYAMRKSDPGYKAAQAKFERLIRLKLGEAAA